MSHSAHFDLDIPVAIHAQLVEAFDVLTPVLLSDWDALAPPRGIGVYGLYHLGALTYVGKADKLADRLGDHRTKLAGRHGISPTEVGATFLTVNPNWSAYAPETILIRHYRTAGLCEWNGSGFGNHDVGRRRDTSAPNGFDRQFPIRREWRCSQIHVGVHAVPDLLARLKAELPYLFRYDKDHRDLTEAIVTIDEPNPTMEQVLRLVSAALPGWQATAFPSHVVLYKESQSYANAQGIIL